ncbi:MAG: MOSC domain-containing protein [Acidobacteriaceae bacterium]|nr:MOSC domain-containing protein [Acidobacteriaceae bacterium]
MVLSQIFVYPIKSARGVAVHEAAVDSSGPLQDRRWMLVDSNGSFLSQRRLPKMALLSPRFSGDDLVVEAPDMPPLVILRWSGEGDWVPVRIWHDQLQLPHPSPRYSEWFSTYLRQSCRLVYLPPTVIRRVEPPYDREEWCVSLADGYPLLLLTQASLDLLNEHLTVPVSIERFRPNLVIAGAAAHEEDQWLRLRAGGVQMAVVKPCARCSIVLVDPNTGERGIEPLQTLARYRRRPHKVFFAQNALVIAPGLLRAGMPIEVLEAAS